MSDPIFSHRYAIGNAFEQYCQQVYPFLQHEAPDHLVSSKEMQGKYTLPDYSFPLPTGEKQYVEIKSGSMDKRRWAYYQQDLLILFQSRDKQLHCSYKRDIVLDSWKLSRSGDGSYYAWIIQWKEVDLAKLYNPTIPIG